MMQLDTMSTTQDSEDLTDLQLPSNFETHDEEEDIALRDLELQMEIESSMYASEEESQEDTFTMSPMDMAIRSLIQLPGDEENSTVWVQTNTGRRAKIILEAEDEEENVGLLEYEDSTQEIRRMQSYVSKKTGTVHTPSTPCKITRTNTLTVPNGIGGARLPSMRAGHNPHSDETVLPPASPFSIPNFPSHRAGKNPNFNPAGAEFF